MVLAKKIQLGNHTAEVRTVTFEDMWTLTAQGKVTNVYTLLWQTLREEDRKYLGELDFSPEQTGYIKPLVDGFLEVNPLLTKKEAEDFLPQKTTQQQTSGSSNSGQPESSAGLSNK